MKPAQLLAERDGLECRYCGCELVVDDPAAAGAVWEPPVAGWSALGWVEMSGYWHLPDGVRWATVDHVVPRALGGSDDLSNLVLACLSCNVRKGARLLEAAP